MFITKTWDDDHNQIICIIYSKVVSIELCTKCPGVFWAETLNLKSSFVCFSYKIKKRIANTNRKTQLWSSYWLTCLTCVKISRDQELNLICDIQANMESQSGTERFSCFLYSDHVVFLFQMFTYGMLSSYFIVSSFHQALSQSVREQKMPCT